MQRIFSSFHSLKINNRITQSVSSGIGATTRPGTGVRRCVLVEEEQNQLDRTTKHKNNGAIEKRTPKIHRDQELKRVGLFRTVLLSCPVKLLCTMSIAFGSLTTQVVHSRNSLLAKFAKSWNDLSAHCVPHAPNSFNSNARVPVLVSIMISRRLHGGYLFGSVERFQWV